MFSQGPIFVAHNQKQMRPSPPFLFIRISFTEEEEEGNALHELLPAEARHQLDGTVVRRLQPAAAVEAKRPGVLDTPLLPTQQKAKKQTDDE